jgi:transcriptional regulator with XRE-family HTH domain
MKGRVRPLKPSQIFAKRMRDVRNRRGWSMRDFSERLSGLGVKLSASQIAKIETGIRHVSLDEGIAIAIALGVSPLHLFVPIDKVQPVALTPKFTQAPTIVRAWVRGTLPFPTSREDLLFVTEAPREEVSARTNPRMLHLEWIYFALLETGVNVEAVEELLLKWNPEISETFEAIKPLIQKGQAERVKQVVELAQDDPELLGRIVADLRRKLGPETQEGEAE